jgi:hypothetical protein
MRQREASEHIRPRDEVEELGRGAPFVAAQSVVPAVSARGGDGLTGRIPPLFAACASLSLVAAVVAAVARAFEPFAHGIWLVAYLCLVGFLAQLLLGRCQAMLLAASPFGSNSPPGSCTGHPLERRGSRCSAGRAGSRAAIRRARQRCAAHVTGGVLAGIPIAPFGVGSRVGGTRARLRGPDRVHGRKRARWGRAGLGYPVALTDALDRGDRHR